jgi:hypothetical protein
MWLGQYARDQIRDRERFQVAFADIDCQPPPGVDRGDFLDEVLYEARCPERFSILEDGLADKLKQYFAKHPWVAQVDKVELRPPHAVRVDVTYRQAVLAIIVPPQYAGSNFTGDKKLPVRGVDQKGVLLPKKAPIVAGLPVLDKAPPPSGPAGKPWGNAQVEAAAQTALLLQPHQKKLELTWMTLMPEGLVLSRPSVKVLWGLPGGAGEVAMDIKLQRLLEAIAALKQPPQPGVVEIDLRPAQAAQIRVVGLH